MAQDAYRTWARWYDAFVEPAEEIVRRMGLALCPPREDIALLDVGCGTGTQLALYRRPGCRLVGIDTSPAMLSQARRTLGASAELDRADATRLPFGPATFDLVTVVFVLHEMPPAIRPAVLAECRRVLKPEGRIMVMDYFPGRSPSVVGWLWRLVITLMEMSAGKAHYRNYRDFLARGGLDPLLEGARLSLDQRYVSEHRLTAVYLASLP